MVNDYIVNPLSAVGQVSLSESVTNDKKPGMERVDVKLKH